MTIQSGDIKLLKSQILSDTSDGGGAITSNEVIDGLSNNLFPDISELDRTYGRIALRKCFPAVDTTTNDSYYGSNRGVPKHDYDEIADDILKEFFVKEKLPLFLFTLASKRLSVASINLKEVPPPDKFKIVFLAESVAM